MEGTSDAWAGELPLRTGVGAVNDSPSDDGGAATKDAVVRCGATAKVVRRGAATKEPVFATGPHRTAST